MSQNSSSGAEMPNDTYPEIHNLWQREWEAEAKDFVKREQGEAKGNFVTCLFAVAYIFVLFVMFVWDRHLIGSVLFAAIMLLSLIIAIKLFKKSRSKDFRFREYPKSFSTFDWYSRLEEPIISKTAHAILSSFESGIYPTEEERSAIFSLNAGASQHVRNGSPWESPMHRIIGLRAMSLSAELARSIPVRHLAESYAHEHEGISASIQSSGSI